MPKLSASTRLTKAQLIERINALEAQVLDKAQLARDMREHDVMHNTQPQLPLVPVAVHRQYYAYIREARAAAKQLGQKVTSYKTFGDWLQSLRNNGMLPS